jgi:hypothetical protein
MIFKKVALNPSSLVLTLLLALGCQECGELENDAGMGEDPCALRDCNLNSHCVETADGSACVCDDGYTYCEDECVLASAPCGTDDGGAIIADAGETTDAGMVQDSGVSGNDGGGAGPMDGGAMACSPGMRICTGHDVYQCNAAGTMYDFVDSCIGDCVDGVCADPCEVENGKVSYLGCTFWAVPLENIALDDGDNFSLAISSNANAPIDVSVTTGTGSVVQNLTLDPGMLQTLDLTTVPPLEGTGITSNTYRIESNGQMTVHQFNPVHEADNHSSDATLLLPVQALGTEYVGFGWPTEFFDIGLPISCTDDSACTFTDVQYCDTDAGVCMGPIAIGKASFSIVATAENTNLVLNSPVPFEVAGASDGGVFQADQSESFLLQMGQVLTLATTSVDRADLSGMRISSDQPVAVFSSSDCAMIPHGTYACDHIEHQLFPTATWGNSYIGAKFHPRGTEDDMWKILAAVPDTVLSTEPSIAGVDGVTLQAGDTILFPYDGHFQISASQPISVGQYMVGSDYPGPEGGCASMGLFPSAATDRASCDIPFSDTCSSNQAVGDPAFVVNVPTSQYRQDYVVYTPADYGENFLAVLTPAGASITLDGEPISLDGGTTIDNTSWRVHTLAVESGVHHAEGDMPFGLMSYGYDCTVSYAYPGGLNLEELNSDP